MLLYDLSDLSSNYCAYLEATCATFPPAFLIATAVTKDMKSIKKELHYWSAMIDAVLHHNKFPAKIIIMGVYTEDDQFEDSKLNEMRDELHEIASIVITKHNLVKVDTLNLTTIHSHDTEQSLLELLHETCASICVPDVSILCQILYTILMDIPDIITLPDLIARLENDKSVVTSALIEDVENLLIELKEKGFLFYIESQLQHDSWIIPNMETFLHKVFSNLLEEAKNHHHNIAKNLGMVQENNLQQIFPDHNVERIASFLKLMGICQEVVMSENDTAAINLYQNSPLFFFPNFVNYSKPKITENCSNCFAWSMDVQDAEKFFPFTFFVALLFEIADQFTLPTSCHQNGLVKYMCDVWSKGIKWNGKKGATIMVEMSDNLKSLSLEVSSIGRSSEYHNLYNSVQNVIRRTFSKHCPDTIIVESVMCPSSVSSDKQKHSVPVETVRKGLINNKEIINVLNGQIMLNLKQWRCIQPQICDLIGVDRDGKNFICLKCLVFVFEQHVNDSAFFVVNGVCWEGC